MIFIPNYQILTQIGESTNTLVYRAVRNQDGTPVILKILKAEYPTVTELTRYKQEYELIRSLDQPGIIKAYDLQKHQNSLVMVLEDFGGDSLKLLMPKLQLKLPEFFSLAIKIVEGLGVLHSSNITHKDINPSNIIFNPNTKQLKLIDLGISTVFKRENPTLKNPLVLEGTLPYMSPEQTGRMNRSLDYRTDFYSLGVTFYELLTGQLPFKATDAMELVHCHLAKQPVPPHLLRREEGEIPQVVSNIVMKLMAKTAEDRYQSAWGLKADLEQCLSQLESAGTIIDFPLSRHDISDKFQIPQKLYGREQEVQSLLTAFERVSQGHKELMLIAGYSGIGKSALVQEIYKPITRAKGYFIAGKFDQFQRNIPYSAVVNAFTELVRQLLSESEAQLRQWKEKLLAALGSNGQVIIDVIPEVELIVGAQPPVAELGSAEAQNRFNLVFQNFIRVFCQPEHPLVVFLDDLQWSDLGTLKLIERMMTDEETQYLFVIGAYRDNEVTPTHPFMMTLEGILQTGARVNQITLTPLALEHISQLIADTLHTLPELVEPLASLVVRKTSSNPFFVNQFLKALYEEKLIAFNFEQVRWEWDISQIEAVGITDNVVELMVNKLRKLPAETQKVLRLGACVGNRFDLNTLSLIHEKSSDITFPDLLPALQEGLVLPTSKLEITELEVLNSPLVIFNFKFLHDRVQQAAYALIPEEQKKAVHLKVGRLLLKGTSSAELEENIFDIVNHLNMGSELLTSQVNRERVAQLNLIAARKAKSSTAYEAALRYLKTGLEMLTEQGWIDTDKLTLSLYLERIECEYITGNFDRAESLVDRALQRIKSNQQKSAVNNIRLIHYQNYAQYEKAIKVGLESLKLFGLKLPYSPDEAALSAAFLEVKQSLGQRKIADLLQAPELIDSGQKTIIRLLMNLVPPTYLINQPLLCLGVLKMTSISLQYGNTNLSTFVYAWYGTILCGNFNEYEAGYEFGSLALQLNEKFNDTSLKGRLYMSFGNFISHWRKSVKNNISIQKIAYQAAMDAGDFSWCHHSVLFGFWQKLVSCSDLRNLPKDYEKYINFAKETELTCALTLILQRNLVLNLQGFTKDQYSLSDETLDETTALAIFQEKNYEYGSNNYHFCKLFIYLLYEKYTDAYEMASVCEKSITAINAQFQVSLHYFYKALIISALYPSGNQLKKQRDWETLQHYQQKLKIWAENCPENFLHQYLLVSAEMARISGKDTQAIDLYDQAIQSAAESEFLQHEALANELAAKFWLAKEKPKIAQTYIREAHYCYQRWGAVRKVEDLEEKYSQFLVKIPEKSLIKDSLLTSISTSSSSSNTAAVLDLATVMKASLAISGEIKLDKLLAKLMSISMENAGARKGFLILPRGGQLMIEATSSVDFPEKTLHQSTTVESSQNLPKTVIYYVERTRTDVVLSNAAIEGRFTTDPYITKRQLKSVLCTPILNQGQLVAILYLENNLTPAAFTPERLQVLRLLSSQAAISLDNALLYASLEEKVFERTQELKEKNQCLEKTLDELTRTQTHLIQSEKMSSLGQLVAGVAHEINNPVNFIYGNLIHAGEYTQDLLHILHLYQQHYPQPKEEIQAEIQAVDLDFLVQDLPKMLSSMKLGADRIRQIVLSLRNFSRLDEAEVKAVNIHEGLDSTLLILQNRLKEKVGHPPIQLIKEYGNLPLVECYAGQLNQVFMNILTNAIDALDEQNKRRSLEAIKQHPSKIRIRTEVRANNQVAIRIADNGSGMSEEVRRRLFDPFFTTKPVGSGTGLGLSISYQIVVDKHGGQLRCHSAPGKGAEFVIEIPIAQLKRQSA